MNAMIFAAGMGKRLYPITIDRPKALAPFLNETLLSYNLRKLRDQGIEKFVINVHHFSELIIDYLDQNKFFGLDITISNEELLMDTAGGIAFARDHFKDIKSPILLYNVDIICNINIDLMLEHHLLNGNDISLAVRNRESSRFLLFDQQNILKAWENRVTGERKPDGKTLNIAHGYAFSGIQIFSHKVLRHLQTNRIYSLIDFYLEEMHQLQIGAYLHDEDYWFDCGNPDKLKTAEEYVARLIQ